MTEQKHFDYESQEPVIAAVQGGKIDPQEPPCSSQGKWAIYKQYHPDAEIKDVKFLMPAKIIYEVNGKEHIKIVHVDLPNKEVYDDKGDLLPKEQLTMFFQFLSAKNDLPEDFYQADEEITRKAADMQDGFLPQ